MKLKGKAKAAFLRRMAKGRNKHTKRTKRRTHTGGKHVAKRRRHHKSSHRKSTRRRHHTGGLGKWLPDNQRLISFASSFGYGKVERAASTDQAHFLNKVPPVIGQIGRAGNLGAMLWLAGVITKHQVVKSVASGVIHVAAYQNGRGPGFTKEAPDFKMGAPSRPGRGRDEVLVEQYLQQQARRGE